MSDACDEQAVDKHLESVIDEAGRVDISFNAVGISDPTIPGVPLVELDVERFSQPIRTWATSYFLTARLAARRMVANRSGVIMTVTTLTLAEMARVAAFIASDDASGMTGTIVNLTMGSVDD